MKNLIVVTAFIMLISGCSTTPNNMRDSAPDVVHNSFKEAKQVSICIAASWESFGVVNSRELNSGSSVSLLLGGKLHYLADITSNEKGSQTKLYKWRSLSVGSDSIFDGAAKCQ